MKKALTGITVAGLVALFALVVVFTTILGATVNLANAAVCATPAAGGSSGTGDYSGPARLPVVGPARVTSNYGMRVNPGSIYRGKLMLHDGVDIAETSGARFIVSATGGTVLKVYTDAIGTNIVTIDAGQGVQISYLHLASFNPAAKPGTKVWPGKPIGIQGATGNVSGPHLHLMIHVNNTPTDPRPWMAARGVTIPAVGVSVNGPPPVTNPPPATLTGPSATAQPAAATLAATASPSPVAPSASTPAPGGGLTLPPPGEPRKDSLHAAPLSIPADIKTLYEAAGKRFGIPWTLLAGIGMAETGHGRNKNNSIVAAQGPMQFMPATFASVGIDGNGDGVKDIRNPADAIFSAANYLVKSGVKTDVRKGILAYNHATWYVNDVLFYAQQYGGGSFTGGDPGASNIGCQDAPPAAVGAAAASAGYEKTAATQAKKWLGQPYIWGGGGITGPTKGGFDCSGFTQNVVYAATGGKLTLVRTAATQHLTDTMATVASYSGRGPADLTGIRPGDVIAMNVPTDPAPWGHVGIYVGGGKVIHAPRPGQFVMVSDLKERWPFEWVARRPLAKYTGTPAPTPTAAPAATTL